MTSLGAKIGEGVVLRMKESGELDWIISDAILTTLESKVREIKSENERAIFLKQIEIERLELGPRPRNKDGESETIHSLILALAIIVFPIVVWCCTVWN